MEWECQWVDNNPQFYRDKEHQEAVKHNIRVNHLIRVKCAEIESLKRSRLYK